jgi:hypothetical protein
MGCRGSSGACIYKDLVPDGSSVFHRGFHLTQVLLKKYCTEYIFRIHITSQNFRLHIYIMFSMSGAHFHLS